MESYEMLLQELYRTMESYECYYKSYRVLDRTRGCTSIYHLFHDLGAPKMNIGCLEQLWLLKALYRMF